MPTHAFVCEKKIEKGYYAPSMGLAVGNKTEPIQLEAKLSSTNFQTIIFIYFIIIIGKKRSQSACDNDNTLSGF